MLLGERPREHSAYLAVWACPLQAQIPRLEWRFGAGHGCASCNRLMSVPDFKGLPQTRCFCMQRYRGGATPEGPIPHIGRIEREAFLQECCCCSSRLCSCCQPEGMAHVGSAPVYNQLRGVNDARQGLRSAQQLPCTFKSTLYAP